MHNIFSNDHLGAGLGHLVEVKDATGESEFTIAIDLRGEFALLRLDEATLTTLEGVQFPATGRSGGGVGFRLGD